MASIACDPDSAAAAALLCLDFPAPSASQPKPNDIRRGGEAARRDQSAERPTGDRSFVYMYTTGNITYAILLIVSAGIFGPRSSSYKRMKHDGRKQYIKMRQVFSMEAPCERLLSAAADPEIA